MALTHSTAARNAAVDAVTALLTTGSKLKFRVGGTLGSPGTAAATLSLASTAFGAASSGVATAGTITSDTNATGNASPVTAASLETGAGTIVIYCAVATSGSDININNTTINAGDTVACSSLTYTAFN